MKNFRTRGFVAGAMMSLGLLSGCGESEAQPVFEGEYVVYQQEAKELVEKEINETGTVALSQALGCLSLSTDSYIATLEDPLFKNIVMDNAAVVLWLPEQPEPNTNAEDLFADGVFTVVPFDKDAPYSSAEVEFDGKGGGIFNPVTLNVADGSIIGLLPDGQEQNCGQGVDAPTFYAA